MDAKANIEVEFLCPFCSGNCSAGRSDLGGKPVAVVVHVLPACADFMRLEPDEFLRAYNQQQLRRN